MDYGLLWASGFPCAKQVIEARSHFVFAATCLGDEFRGQRRRYTVHRIPLIPAGAQHTTGALKLPVSAMNQ